MHFQLLMNFSMSSPTCLQSRQESLEFQETRHFIQCFLISKKPRDEMRQSCFFRAREISSCTLILSRERNQTRGVTCSCLVSTFIETRRDRLFMVSSRALIKIFRNVHRLISISYFCILYHKRSSETLKKCFVTLYTALRFYFHVLFSAFIILF